MFLFRYRERFVFVSSFKYVALSSLVNDDHSTRYKQQDTFNQRKEQRMIYDIGSNDNNFQAEIKCSVKAF